MHNYY